MSLCTHCQKSPIPRGKRRYCANCSPIASRILKARQRQQWNADWRNGGKQGEPPYLDSWPSRQAFRDYYRVYMKAWRRNRRARQAVQPGDALTAPAKGGSHA